MKKSYEGFENKTYQKIVDDFECIGWDGKSKLILYVNKKDFDELKK